MQYKRRPVEYHVRIHHYLVYIVARGRGHPQSHISTRLRRSQISNTNAGVGNRHKESKTQLKKNKLPRLLVPFLFLAVGLVHVLLELVEDLFALKLLCRGHKAL